MDDTSVGKSPQRDDLAGCCTVAQFDQWIGAAGERSGGTAGGGTRDGADAAEVSGSLEENHKCCAPAEEELPHSVDPAAFELADYQVVARGCKNRHCPDCCEHLGVKLRERVREVVGGWKACLLVTLTIDPRAVSGPVHAMERVRERRALSRLVRSLLKSGHLKSGRYFAAIEFQKNGNPHWHLLLETSFVPVERVQELWDRNRPNTAGPVDPGRPGFGYVWISKESFQSPQHAANYVTKYVLKFPQEGYPDWVLDYLGRVPKYSTSRRFWGENGEEKEPEIEPEWCFCSRCRGEQAAGVWKPIDLPPAEWQVFKAVQEQHVVGMLPNGLERREVLFGGEAEPLRRKHERQTIRERVGACGTVGAVVLHRTTVTPPRPDAPRDANGFQKGEVKTKWYWMGMLNVPFAEFVEHQGERRRRYRISPEKALEITGVIHPWAMDIWKRGRGNSIMRDEPDREERCENEAGFEPESDPGSLLSDGYGCEVFSARAGQWDDRFRSDGEEFV